MQIIIEGPDGSGKSTLIKALKGVTDWELIPGQGPEAHPGEILDRIGSYISAEKHHQSYGSRPRIYDRHPCVSHPIYCQFTPVTKMTEQEVTSRGFYELKSLFVYCQSPDLVFGNHNAKEYDTEEHLKAISENHMTILREYRSWAMRHAHMIHRYWEPRSTDRTVHAIIAATGENL